MRSRLLDAAVECLYELGYARTTTIEVAARAGVSRGAQLHHFPTKERLVTVAVRHVLEKRLEEFREAVASLPDGPDKAKAAVDILGDKLSGRAFYAWLELVVAARTDPNLRGAVSEIAGQFRDEVQATAREIFTMKDDRLSIESASLYAMAALQGFALDRIVWPDGDGKGDGVVTAFRSLVAGSLRVQESPRSASSEPMPKSSPPARPAV